MDLLKLSIKKQKKKVWCLVLLPAGKHALLLVFFLNLSLVSFVVESIMQCNHAQTVNMQ